LADPPTMLERLCRALGIDWDPAMLGWEPGIRATDGIWASHWYDAVAASTGFSDPDERPVELGEESRRVAEACRPHYDRLAAFRLRPAEPAR
jgi:hypothetical protein